MSNITFRQNFLDNIPVAFQARFINVFREINIVNLTL